MRRFSLITPVIATLACTAPLTAQSLADRVERAPADAAVSFQVPARSDVCGFGDAVIRFHDGDRDGYSVMWHRGDWNDLRGLGAETIRSRCEYGPIQVTLERSGSRVARVRARVAATPPAGTTNLGTVTTREAADYLIGTVARHGNRKVAGEAMALFTVAEGESWQPLLALARDRGTDEDVRKQAVFWLGQAASTKATEGLKGILSDSDEEIEVRKQAIFALSQQRNPEAVDALMVVAQSSKEPELRKQALFWLGQRADDDPRVLALFEKILLGGK